MPPRKVSYVPHVHNVSFREILLKDERNVDTCDVASMCQSCPQLNSSNCSFYSRVEVRFNHETGGHYGFRYSIRRLRGGPAVRRTAKAWTQVEDRRSTLFCSSNSTCSSWRGGHARRFTEEVVARRHI